MAGLVGLNPSTRVGGPWARGSIPLTANNQSGWRADVARRVTPNLVERSPPAKTPWDGTLASEVLMTHTGDGRRGREETPARYQASPRRAQHERSGGLGRGRGRDASRGPTASARHAPAAPSSLDQGTCSGVTSATASPWPTACRPPWPGIDRRLGGACGAPLVLRARRRMCLRRRQSRVSGPQAGGSIPPAVDRERRPGS